MSPKKRRFASLVFFTVVLLLVVCISSAVYYLKIQSNEDYQNQLHFRELNTAAQGVKDANAQFSRIGKTVLDLMKQNNSGNEVFKQLDNVINRAKNTDALANFETLELSAEKLRSLCGDLSKGSSKPQTVPESGMLSNCDSHSVYFSSLSDKENDSKSGNNSDSNSNTDSDSDSKLLAVKVPNQDFLPDHLLSFPMVILANKQGDILAEKVYLQNSIYAADLEFDSVSLLFKTLSEQQFPNIENDQSTPIYSGTIEQLIAGIKYRIFIQPVKVSLNNESSVTHYLLGFVPLSDMQIAKLSISPSAGLWLFILLLILSSLIPILKIRFTSNQTHFSKTDISLFFTGAIMLLGMLSITVHHQLFYSYLMDFKKEQAKTYIEDIQGEFGREVDAIKQKRETLPSDIAIFVKHNETEAQTSAEGEQTNKSKLPAGDYSSKLLSNIRKALYAFTNELNNRYALVEAHSTRGLDESARIYSVNQTNSNMEYMADNLVHNNGLLHGTHPLFIESMFKLNHKGNIPFVETDFDSKLPYEIRLPILRISDSSHNFTDFSLAHRPYFQRAIRCQLWFASDSNSDVEGEKDCRKGFFMQRIKNVSDGRFSTQFAYSDFSKINETDFEQRQVESISVKLHSFFSKILPSGYGYAVIDEKGEVLYHADESRALLENMLVETNNDEHLVSLLSSVEYAGTNKMAEFTTTYRNAEHLFLASKLTDNVPWHIVIFFNTDELTEYTLWLLLVAVVLFVQLMLALLIWNRYVSNQLTWSKLITFKPKSKEMKYGAFAVLVFSLAFALLMFMGVIVGLAPRLALWSLCATLLIFVLCKQVQILPNRALFWTHPSASFALLFIIFLSISIKEASDFDIQWQAQSWPFVIAGLASLLVGVTCYFLAYSKRFLRFYASTSLYKNTKQLSKLRFFQAPWQASRYSKGYVFYLTALLWLFSIVPAAMFINASNHYLLGFQAYQESLHIEQQIDQYQQKRLAYLQLMRPEMPHTVSINTSGIFNSLYLNNEEPNWITVLEKPQPESTNNLTVDFMINELVSLQSFGASLNQQLYEYAQLKSKPSHLDYNGNLFLQSALASMWLWVLITFLIVFAISYQFSKRFIVYRVMGEHIPDHFRQPIQTTSHQHWVNRLQEFSQSKHAFKALILRTNNRQAVERIKKATKLEVYENTVFDISQLLVLERKGQSFMHVDALSMAIEDKNNKSAESSTRSASIVLVIKGLENLAFTSEQRKTAQSLLYELHRIDGLSIVFLCEVAPLYRLCHQEAYPGVPENEYADANESLAWATLLAQYTKLYDWTPPTKHRLDINASPLDVLGYESKGWFQLFKIQQLFEDTYANQLQHIDKHWKHGQIVEFFCSHAGAIYRHKWSQCTRDERILLFQLANGATLNPNSIETLEQLLRRGYIYRDSGWFIVNESFKRFVLRAESEETFANWMSDADVSAWQYVRVPVLVTIIVLAVMIVVSTGQSLQSFIAAATASLGLLPSIMRNLSFFKSNSTPAE